MVCMKPSLISWDQHTHKAGCEETGMSGFYCKFQDSNSKPMNSTWCNWKCTSSKCIYIKPESYLYSFAVSHLCTLLASKLDSIDRRGNVQILLPLWRRKKKHGLVIGVWRIDRWESVKLECCALSMTSYNKPTFLCCLPFAAPATKGLPSSH